MADTDEQPGEIVPTGPMVYVRLRRTDYDETQLASWASAVRETGRDDGFVDTEITRRAAAEIAARSDRSQAQALATLGAMNHIGRLHEPAEVAEVL